MKLIEAIVSDHLKYIDKKNIMEIACGEASFAFACKDYAAKVYGSDLTLKRVKSSEGIELIELDAKELHTFVPAIDTIVCYNGIGHLEDLEAVVASCLEKLEKGTICFINTWKLDKTVTYKKLIPLLHEYQIPYELEENNKYQGIYIHK